ncbi:lupeol synthase-like protein [Tanacetum coccineum]
MVIALYVTGAMNVVLTPAHQLEIKRYIYNHQNEDGGWGLHIEGHSTMFGSVLSYITLRLLGEEADTGAEDMAVFKGRKWILDHGGAVGTPSWGKFWLTVCFPAIILPTHWFLEYMNGEDATLCHRNFGSSQIFFQSIQEDLYYPHPLVQDMVWGVLHNVAEPILTRWPFSMLREKALKVGMEHVHYERNVAVLCLIATWVEDPNGDAYKRHLARIPDYLWVAEDGMKMQSFGSQTWDAAFAIQAIMSSNLGEVYGPNLRKAQDFVKSSQVRKNPPGDFKKMYRHISKGAWTFSMQDHGWQVSDCTAEGLKVALLYSQMSPELVGENFETEHLYDAVNVILSLQSENGGFPAWEPQRAYSWYVECTSSAIKLDTLQEVATLAIEQRNRKIAFHESNEVHERLRKMMDHSRCTSSVWEELSKQSSSSKSL